MRPVLTTQMRTVPSFEALARRALPSRQTVGLVSQKTGDWSGDLTVVRLPCDSKNPFGMPLELGDRLASFGIPDAHRFVHATGRQLGSCQLGSLATLVCSAHTLAPSGLQLTPNTHPVWPLRVYLGVPVSVSHILAVLSPLPVASRLDDCGENWQVRMGCPWPGMRCAMRDTAWTLKTA